jgi:protein-S-isoprenylcysteine O-methyltransferase Ste14
MGAKIFLRVLIFFPICMGLFFFLPAGSFRFWEAWVYSVVLFIPMITTLTYLVRHDAALLERRMRFKEKEEKQKSIIRFARLPFLIGFFIPGFDYRYDWSQVSIAVAVVANIIVFLGYFMVFLVFRENTYTSRIVEVEKDQKVITTGPYSIVRHPMYTGTILMVLATPLALGSWWAILAFILWPVVIVTRIFNEEAVLHKELPGYTEYCQKVHYRLIPFVW